MIKKLIAFFLFAGLILSYAAFGEDVRILAKSKRQDLNSFVAEGDVTVIFGEYRIYADYIEYNRILKVITAKGKVTISTGMTVLSGEDLVFNVKKKNGIMYKVKGNSQPTVSYNSDKMEQVDNETIKMKKFSFTSCTQLKPRWKIDSSSAKIKKGKYIQIVSGFLKIKNIPVFYFPYMKYPLQKNGRATGFLFPVIKNSTFRGFTLNTAFYWDIRPNLDLTLFYDYYQKLGRGFAGETRYKFRNSEGKVKFYLFKYLANTSLDDLVKNDSSLSDEEKKQFLKGDTTDSYMKIQHKQKLKLFNTTINVDVDEPSDPEFMRVFTDDFEQVIRTNYKKRFSLSSTIGFVKFDASYSKSTTYYINDRKKYVTTTPSVNLRIYDKSIWKIPGYFSLNARFYSNRNEGQILHSSTPDYITGQTISKFSFTPAYSLNILNTPWVKTNLKLTSFYHIYLQSKDQDDLSKIVNSRLNLNYNMVTVTMSGPGISKVYNLGKNRLKHVITPTIVFRYTTKYDDDDFIRVPVSSYGDFPAASIVQASLSSKLYYKKAGSLTPKEIINMYLKQSYFFDPALAAQNYSNRRIDNGKYPQFSELEAGATFKILRNFSLTGSINYNYYLKEDKLTRLRLTAKYLFPKDFGNFSLDYYSRVDPYLDPDSFYRDQKSVSGTFFLDFKRAIPIKLYSRVDYDITNKIFRNFTNVATFKYQCIDFLFKYKILKRGGQLDSEFSLGFTFGNMGSVGDFLDKKEEKK